MKGCETFVCGAFTPENGRIGTLWFVMTIQNDKYHSGDSILAGNKEYVLGRRELLGKGDIVSYEMIKREEVLEL